MQLIHCLSNKLTEMFVTQYVAEQRLCGYDILIVNNVKLL